METCRNFIPSEEHNGHESRLHEESNNALYGQRGAKNIAHKPRIVTPIRTKLEFKDDTRGHSHRKIHAEKLLPETGSILPKALLCTVIAGFHDTHDNGKS